VSLDGDDPAPAARQLGSHRKQLVAFARHAVTPATVDAIVVPTARPADLLKDVIDLARAHKCALVVLCSRQARARDVIELVRGAGLPAATAAIDIGADLIPADVVPDFATDEIIAGTRFVRVSDLSLKRNLALLLASRSGWRRIVFLDDDIVVPRETDLALAAGLVNDFPAVGLGLGGFPDNSVVCHAKRAVGKFQETFIGGGAMAVNVRTADSFFPNIYNEDWFFLAGGTRPRASAVVGEALQDPYDPFTAPRARGEEFGDCLAEGLYALVDTDQLNRAETTRYWAEFLLARQRLITEIMAAVRTSAKPAEERKRIHDALYAAHARSRMIEPAFCVEYLRCWHADRKLWCDCLGEAQRAGSTLVGGDRLLTAADQLGLGGATWYLRGLAEQFLDEHGAGVHGAVAGHERSAMDHAQAPVLVAKPQVQPSGIGVVQVDSERDLAMA
jgi:hypothetical protein